MKYWPVPDSYFKQIPAKGSPGSFWENRGDRFHCGVDIYAPENSNVYSIEKGKVKEIGIFTSPEIVKYWNKTLYVIIKGVSGLFYKYAEMNSTYVNVDETVETGQLIGHIGLVLNSKKINEKSPEYIKRIKEKGKLSMLHLELYNRKPFKNNKYIGGNLFHKIKPKTLLDPNKVL